MGVPAPTRPSKPSRPSRSAARKPAASTSGPAVVEPHSPIPPSESAPTAMPNREAPREAAPTRDAVLSRLLRHGDATAGDLASQLGLSVQGLRRHLRSLEEDGLVDASPAVEGPGRPSNRWRLTEAGRSRFTDGSGDFALGLLHSLATSLPPGQIEDLMDRQAELKAAGYRSRIGQGPLAERLERLVELRRREGFVAELLADPDTPAAWIISEFHCSVMRIAEEFPIICDQELQLIRRTFPDCQVERVHWRLEEGHSCGFRLRPSPEPA
jgi:DeoR family suf operon transcriptional repressor